MNEHVNADGSHPAKETAIEEEEYDRFIDQLAERSHYTELLEIPEDWMVTA